MDPGGHVSDPFRQQSEGYTYKCFFRDAGHGETFARASPQPQSTFDRSVSDFRERNEKHSVHVLMAGISLITTASPVATVFVYHSVSTNNSERSK